MVTANLLHSHQSLAGMTKGAWPPGALPLPSSKPLTAADWGRPTQLDALLIKQHLQSCTSSQHATQAAPSGHYDSETAAYLAQQGTPQQGVQEGTPSVAAPGSIPFQDASAAAAAEAASMLPPGVQGSQPVQMPMPHELSASYYGWSMAYQQPLEQPAVRHMRCVDIKQYQSPAEGMIVLRLPIVHHRPAHGSSCLP